MLTVRAPEVPSGWPLEAFRGDWITTRLRSGLPYEHLALRVLAGLQRPGVFLDVGAHIGNHAAYMAMRGWEVVCIEPDPRTADVLERNLARLPGRSVVHRVGAGDARGGAVLDRDAARSGNTGATRLETEAAGDIEVRPLDDLDVVPDVIKIDVEGWELAVIAGAEGLLARFRPAVLVESHDGPGEVARALRRFGHRLVGRSLASSPTFLFVSRPLHVARSVAWRLRSSVLADAARTIRG